MKELPHTRSCFVCGESNPSGLRLRFETDGQQVRTCFMPREEHIGFRETVHGGLVATVLDEIMVWACAVRTRRFGYCAELQVRYVNPVRPGRQTIATAELVADRRGKIFEARAELRGEEGLLLATATGKYLPIRHTDALEMATEFVGDARWVFEPPAA